MPTPPPPSAFRPAGPGHNLGPPLEPPDPERRWRATCWRRARAELVPRLPLEVVRRRVARARELGLAYPDYASILLGTGRDVIAFLFTSEALGLRLRKGLAPPPETLARLAELRRCDRLLLDETRPEALADAFARAYALPFAGAGRAPGRDAGWGEGRRAIRAVLAPLGLPGDAVVMVGAREPEAGWAAAARLARFLPAERYFGRSAD